MILRRSPVIALAILLLASAWDARAVIKPVPVQHAAKITTAQGSSAVPPIRVIAQLPPRSQEELRLEAQDHAERSASDRETAHTNLWLICIGIVQAVIFALQLVAFVIQAMRLNDTVRMAREQSEDMRRSIEHAARSATAMEAAAQALSVNTQNTTELLNLQRLVFTRQMRAYLVPLLLGFVAQDLEKNNRLEVRVLVKNGGNTPSHTIKAVFHLAVMPAPLPVDTDLGLPTAEAPAVETYGFLASQDNFYLRAWLPDFLSEDELAEIKKQRTKALYAYGVIHYKDIFEEQRTAYFCKMVGWDLAGNALWLSVAGRNDAT